MKIYSIKIYLKHKIVYIIKNNIYIERDDMAFPATLRNRIIESATFN